jgi:hypothetical protein
MSDLPAPRRSLIIRTNAGADDVRVGVTDHGTGIRADSIDNIFEPFFTTKQTGLGLGLAICRRIILAHAGRIWAENNDEAARRSGFDLPTQQLDGARSSPPRGSRSPRADPRPIVIGTEPVGAAHREDPSPSLGDRHVRLRPASGHPHVRRVRTRMSAEDPTRRRPAVDETPPHLPRPRAPTHARDRRSESVAHLRRSRAQAQRRC